MLVLFFICLALIGGLWLWVFTPSREFSLRVIWSDPNLRSSYENPVWYDADFSEGWRVISSSNPLTSGFEVLNRMGVLYADFEGNATYIQIGKSVTPFSTQDFPYIVIIHKEDTSAYEINFSFGVVDENDVFHDGGWFHSSRDWKPLVFDLTRAYNGTVGKIYIRLTNDFDTSYAGGIRHSYLESVAVYQFVPENEYRDAPNWELISDKPVNAKLNAQNHVLSIRLSNIAPNGSLIAAQRVGGFAFDLRNAGYLQVSIKTSSLSVIARIVVWTEDGKDHLILLKTYNDNQWHTEVVQLSAFGVSGTKLLAVQLGMIAVNSEAPLIVSYKDLSFISWVPK
jgi:hypothetical protein